jgi:hypothetical protein
VEVEVEAMEVVAVVVVVAVVSVVAVAAVEAKAAVPVREHHAHVGVPHRILAERLQPGEDTANGRLPT